jgi:archaellum biogenesis ATPase FlaH
MESVCVLGDELVIGDDPSAMDPEGDESYNRELLKLGIFTSETLKESIGRDERKQFVVEGLLGRGSVNLLVGDSGLGKTPLSIQIGMCVAAGISVFERTVQKGSVLYCDAESGKHDFFETMQSVARFLGLSEPPPNFHVWSPNWEVATADEERWSSDLNRIRERVDAVEPSLVVIDALRSFWPEAEAKNQNAAETLKGLKKSKGVTWMVLHHRRKTSHERVVADLAESPNQWFQESAGSMALVNQSDTRIGVEPHPQRETADLLVAGFIRGKGPFVPLDLTRVRDEEEGAPVGYRLLTGIERLNPEDRKVYNRLPSRFKFKDVLRELGGQSDSNAARFLKRCESFQLAKKMGRAYVKVERQMESVEGVEQAAPQTPCTPRGEG